MNTELRRTVTEIVRCKWQTASSENGHPPQTSAESREKWLIDCSGIRFKMRHF